MISIGIVGAGLIGARRLQIVRELGYHVAFLVDPKLAGSPPGVPEHRVADSIEQLEAIGVPPVEAVFVAVPHDLAPKCVRWALERECHVLCEKPLGTSLTEATAIQQLVAAKGVNFCAGFNYRFLPGVTALRGLLTQGKLGTLYRVGIIMGHGGRPGMQQEWKLQKARAGGGALIDPGIHLLDLVRFLWGEAAVTTCRVRRRFWATDVEDNCSLGLSLGEADFAIEVSLTHWINQFRIEVYGSEGMAVLEGRGGNYGNQTLRYTNRWFWRPGCDDRESWELGIEDPSFRLETTAFLDQIESGRPSDALSNVADACAALQLVEQLYRQAGETA